MKPLEIADYISVLLNMLNSLFEYDQRNLISPSKDIILNLERYLSFICKHCGPINDNQKVVLDIVSNNFLKKEYYAKIRDLYEPDYALDIEGYIFSDRISVPIDIKIKVAEQLINAYYNLGLVVWGLADTKTTSAVEYINNTVNSIKSCVEEYKI